MKLGAYTACLHDRPLPEALRILRELGLDGAEVNSGGFLPAPHLPVEQLRRSATAREDHLGVFSEAGIELTALNCNGNPLHPDPEVGDKHGQDVFDAIELAALLGVGRVVTMSGLPAAEPGGRRPAWAVLPWDSVHLDVRDHQWDDVAVPYWREVQRRAADADVKVCIEMHPHNVVYNPATLGRLATEISATHVGAELDPSHLMCSRSTRSPPSAPSAGWSTTRRPRTCGSTTRCGSTACSTTGSAASRRTTPARCRWAAATP